jgi:uncharacterized protein YaeQ
MEPSHKIVLSNGREVSFNLDLITLREYRNMFNPSQLQKDEDEIITRVTGLTVDEYLDLTQPDSRRVLTEFFRIAREPLASPNSVSASTSD